MFCLKDQSFLNLINKHTHTLSLKDGQDVTGLVIEFVHIPQESPRGIQLLEQSVVCLR